MDGRVSGVRQGWPPYGRDRKAGLVHNSLARGASEGRRPTDQSQLSEFKII